MPSHQFKFCRKGGVGTNGSDLCAVKRLRRLATTLANVADVAELLQRHAVLVHCSTVRDARGVPSFGPTTPLSAKQAQEAIHRLQSGRSHDGMVSPGAQGCSAGATAVALFAQPPAAATPSAHPALRWKHPELFPGTIMLPNLEGTLPEETQNQVDDRFKDRHVVKTQFDQPLTDTRTNNHPTGFDLQHIKESTEAEIPLIHPHLDANENNTRNTPGGDSTCTNSEQPQSAPKTNKTHGTGYSLQNDMRDSQLHTMDGKPTSENSMKMKNSCTLTEGTVTEHLDSTDTKLPKEKSDSDKTHSGSDNHVPQWTLAATQIHFKPLFQTPNRPIQPHADDFMLVMHLLEKDHKNDPNYLRSIGVAVSNNQARARCTASKRLQTTRTVLPTPPKPSLASSANRAQKLSQGIRRCHRSSATQRRQNRRAPKPSAQRKPGGGGGGGPAVRPTANGKQGVCKPCANAAPKAPAVQKHQSSTSQRGPKSSTAVAQQRAAPEAKRVAQAPAASQKKLPIVSSGASHASQSSVSSTPTSKPLLTPNLRRVLETSTAKTQTVLKRAASDCQRLSRISTPSTNSLLKRVASDLKKISRDSMTSFHNLQQMGSKLCVQKPSATRTGEGACLNNSILYHKKSKEPLSHSSREIKCHMPVVKTSVERYSVTKITTEKPYVTKSTHKSNTMVARKGITSNPVSIMPVLEANPKPQHKNKKNNLFDGPHPQDYSTNTQDAGKYTPFIPCSKIPLPKSRQKLIQNSEKTNPWEGLRPPECCTNSLQQNLTSPPLFQLQLPPAEKSTVQPVGIHNVWNGIQSLSTKTTLIPKPPSLPPFHPLIKECVSQPEETNIGNQPQLSESEGKECVFCADVLPASDIKNNTKEDIESFATRDTSAESTITHTATTKSLISHSQTSQESLMAVETLSSRKCSLSSSASSTGSFFSSDAASQSEMRSVNKNKRDYSTCDDSQSVASGKSSASSNKRSPFFRKVKNIFRNRFCRCKTKLPCMRSRGSGSSGSRA